MPERPFKDGIYNPATACHLTNVKPTIVQTLSRHPIGKDLLLYQEAHRSFIEADIRLL